MTETKPKRRWFRFSLRTLFVLITIAGIAFGWLQSQRNLIQQRQEFLANLPQTERDISFKWEWMIKQKLIPTFPVQSVSIVRKALGDAAYCYVFLPEDSSNEAIGEANRLFPEAHIYRSDGKNELIDVTQ